MATEGVILAAGLSSRTAPACKLLFKLAGQTILERSISSMEPFCSHIFVITGAHEAAVANSLCGREGITLVHNLYYNTGMYESYKAGLRCTNADNVFLLPGDCPFVRPEVYAALLAVEGDIVLPVWHGHAGHPVLLRRSVISEVPNDNISMSLHHYIIAHHPTWVAVDCPGILTDIDTIEEYRKALGQLPLKGERGEEYEIY